MEERAGAFVVDFLVPRLVGKDINEMWKLDNPMGLLSAVLQSRGMASPESRYCMLYKIKSYTVMRGRGCCKLEVHKHVKG